MFSPTLPTFLFSLRGVVEEDKVAEHCGEPEQPEAGDDHDDGVLKVKLSSSSVNDEQELETVGLYERAPVFLVVEGVTKVPPEVVEDAEVVRGQAVGHKVPVQVAVPGNLW
jgi:hypothetical protein